MFELTANIHDEGFWDKTFAVPFKALDAMYAETASKPSEADIIELAQNLGVLPADVPKAVGEMEEMLGISSISQLEKLKGKDIDVIYVQGAAGLSPWRRLLHALNIAGQHEVRRIIIGTTDRPVLAEERKRVLPDWQDVAETETDLVLNAIWNLCGVEAESVSSKAVYRASQKLVIPCWEASFDCEGTTSGYTIQIEVYEVPPDPGRLVNGHSAGWADAAECMSAISDILDDAGTICVVGHDIWQPALELKAWMNIPGTTIVGSGPCNIGRVKYDEKGNLQVDDLEAVSKELKRIYDLLSTVKF